MLSWREFGGAKRGARKTDGITSAVGCASDFLAKPRDGLHVALLHISLSLSLFSFRPSILPLCPAQCGFSPTVYDLPAHESISRFLDSLVPKKPHRNDGRTYKGGDGRGLQGAQGPEGEQGAPPAAHRWRARWYGC
jgi:hypothetical protein